MKLLISDKEIINYLLTNLNYIDCEEEELVHYRNHVEEVIGWWKVKKNKDHERWNEKKWAPKLKDRLKKAVEADVRQYIQDIKDNVDAKKEKNRILISKKLNYILKKLSIKNVLQQYKKSNVDGFVKSTGLTINSRAILIKRSEYTDNYEEILLRNTGGNETLLSQRIASNNNFWFIDSGYTNFLETNKKWHRLVQGHLHFNKMFQAPVDRLKFFKDFPRQWRTDGDKILVLEPGPFAANIFNVNLKSWKHQVESELRKYTDKKIIFREKSPKKKRDPLYQSLCDDDFYCTISINSNSATESIWAGVPAITLDKHISNFVTKNKISDINALYKGSLAEWLAVVSYSQFTYDELVNGTAVSILKKYHV